MALGPGQKFVWVLLVLGNFVNISLQASSPSSDSYVAAVVEYAPVSGATLENKEEIFMQNVAVYGCFMEQAAKQGVDIIVFPEIGLASSGVPHNPDGTPSLAFYVPEPGSNPCNDNSSEVAQGLRDLSCSARRHGLYAVVNLPERVNCTGCPCPGFPVTVDGDECPPSGAYFHNTNVVFDRTGTIVARYRKFHLFGEPGFVPTLQPEYATFDTDFGVTFGTFICFDILFESPAAELVTNHSICDFAFPTAWYSEVPFLTAVQTQAAWAYAMDVNLLAAGYDKPEVGSSGSGIFVGRGGTLQAVMPNTTTSQLLVGTVPKMRRCQESAAARARCRRASLDADVMPPEGDDDESVEERTPLSAFHHIVRKRKLGHLDAETEGDDESAPPFIHHTMYDRDGDAARDGDSDDDEDDDSQPPSGEYETKVPPHFMGLQKVAQGEDDDDQGCEENGVEGKAEGDTSQSGQTGGIPEKSIPTSTSTDTDTVTDPYGFSEPSQNPDLLKLYQDEPDEQLPAEFLEIEVPEEHSFEPEREQEYFKLPNEVEIPPSVDEKEEHGESQNPDLLKLYQDKPDEQLPAEFHEIEVPEERSFEPEREQEYYKIPETPEIPPSVHEMEEHRRASAEKENDQLLPTDDGAAAVADSPDVSIPLLEEEKQSEEKDVDTTKGEESDSISRTTYNEERNATEQEIEDTRKQFEWLTDDKEDSPEQGRDLSSAPSAGKEAPTPDHMDDTDDDTDDVLPDDHGLHLVDSYGHHEGAPTEEHVDDTDDILSEHHGVHLSDDDGKEQEALRRKQVDDTDDVLPEHHGVHELDATAATDTSPKQEAGGDGELAEGSKAETLADSKEPATSPRKLKKHARQREMWRSRMDRVKQNAGKCKCRQKHRVQKSPTEAVGSITDDKPIGETSEEGPESVAEDAQPQEQQAPSDDLNQKGATEETQPEEQHAPPEDLDREGTTEETQPEEQRTPCDDLDQESAAEDTQREEQQAPSDDIYSEGATEDYQLEEQPTNGDDFNTDAIAEDTQPEEEPTIGDDLDLQAIAEDTQPAEQDAKDDLEVDSSKPKRPCRLRERREAACPPFSDGVLDDARVNRSTVGLFLKRDHLDVYKTFTLNTDTLIENSTVILCHGTFCCNFHVVLEVNAELDQPRYAYRLAVFNGVRTFDGVATGGVQVCAVIPCSHDDMDSCGMLTLPDEAAYSTVFRVISISGIFSTNHTLVTANTLGPGLLPLAPDRFNVSSSPLGEGAARVTMSTSAAVQEGGASLFTFAIYSRVFNRDGQPATTPP